MSLPPLRRASTVVLIRDGASGLEVLLLQRHRRSPFLPDAWVFPGGRVDDTDGLAPERFAGDISVPGMERDEAKAHAVAGIRETFEESGIWVGREAVPRSSRSKLAEQPARFERWMAAHELVVDLSLLRPWSRWVTPDSEPRRYDTLFFVARFEEDWATAMHDEQETVDSGWFRPQDVIQRTIRSFPLAPPTWWVLVELSRFSDVAGVMGAQARHCLPVQPVLAFSSAGMDVLLPGHPGHTDATAIDGHPRCIEMRNGAWVVAP